MSRVKGNFAETRVCEYLISEGFVIVERNFYSRFGEIDIIASRNGILHFIEVKSGKNFDPVYAVTPSKLSKIIKTVDYFFLKTGIDTDYQIDAVIVKSGELVHLENITAD
ncbi:YraN family protein [Nitrosophilus alvini]|uniref:YraN family protein n=1 Tax=Nitrosophilus alvini TaxID=2714855 RepID=UPI00190B8DF9|nr:YraN family protein [Nitrosophilus alvini]